MSQHFYVYYGHMTDDNYDRTEPIHNLVRCDREDTVIRMKQEFIEEGHTNCSNCFFTVIRGNRVELLAVQKVVTWALGEELE